MFLSRITTDAARFQKRSKPWSENTVESIVREGIDLAKFDPIPLLDMGDGSYCVAGDGHSRFEAIRRLAADARLPQSWAIDPSDPATEWDIPHRIVTAEQARKLSRTANLSRDQFQPAEEAAVYAEMQAEGMSLEQIAAEAHRHVDTVKRTLTLNTLCQTIKDQIGKPINAGGITKDSACELAEQFSRWAIDHQCQQQLYRDLLVKMDLTPAAVRGLRGLFAKVGQASRERHSQAGFFFSVPPNVDVIIAESKKRAAALARAERSVAALVALADGDVLDGVPDLKVLLSKRGESWIAQLKYEQDADGASIGAKLEIAA